MTFSSINSSEEGGGSVVITVQRDAVVKVWRSNKMFALHCRGRVKILLKKIVLIKFDHVAQNLKETRYVLFRKVFIFSHVD